jgi:hypothetical protein
MQNPLAATIGRTPNNAQAQAAMDAQGALSSSQRHAKMFAAANAGTLFHAANPAGVTTTVALAAVYVGLCLSNPLNSGVNVAVGRVTGLFNVAPAALTALGLIAGYSAAVDVVHTAALTPHNSFVGTGAAAKAKVDSSSTLPAGTPYWAHWFGETPGATSVGQFDEDFDGAIILPPGGYVAIGSLIAGPAAGFLGSFVWEELPVAA